MAPIIFPRDLKVYCDMDGVLCDFPAAVNRLGPEAAKGLEEEATQEDKQKMYDAIEESGEKFWAEMPWMKDAKGLWTLVSKLRPVLLTSPGKFKYAKSGKQQWIDKNIPGTPVFFSDYKTDYVERDAVLIDDRLENVAPWRKDGGVGILHESVEETEEELLSILLSGMNPRNILQLNELLI